jgi:MerR family transcriptional regulator/heat shock protein HspR
MGYYRVEAAATLTGLSSETILYCVEEGVVRPAMADPGGALMGEVELARLRKVRRLTQDLGINMEGVEVVLRLLDEIEALRAELARR